MQIAKGFRSAALNEKFDDHWRSVGLEFHGIRIAKGSYSKSVSIFRSKPRFALSEKFLPTSPHKEVLFGSLREPGK